MEVKKTSLVMKSIYEINYIQNFKHHNLLDVEIIDKNDEVYEFKFNKKTTYLLEKLKKSNIIDRYRFLINIASISDLTKEISFSINVDNLVYDDSFNPYILIRDIKHEEFNFLDEYKLLIAFLLNDKYQKEDVYNAGINALADNKLTNKYIDLNDVESIKKELINDLNQLVNDQEKNYILVKKQKNKRTKTINKVLIVCSIIFMVFIGFQTYDLINLKNINKMEESYIDKKYIDAVESGNKVSLNKMSINAKYIYALSVINNLQFTQEQQGNILSGLSSNSNEKLLDYWIYIGRKEFDKAYDIGVQINDKQYQGNALIYKKDYITQSTDISQEQREQILSDIDSKLSNLGIIDNK